MWRLTVCSSNLRRGTLTFAQQDRQLRVRCLECCIVLREKLTVHARGQLMTHRWCVRGSPHEGCGLPRARRACTRLAHDHAQLHECLCRRHLLTKSHTQPKSGSRSFTLPTRNATGTEDREQRRAISPKPHTHHVTRPAPSQQRTAGRAHQPAGAPRAPSLGATRPPRCAATAACVAVEAARRFLKNAW